MHTGIQDAANFAWKLAYVLRGKANGSLLDSYERERRPVAREVVSTTDRLTRLATLRSPVARSLRNAGLQLAGRTSRLPKMLATNLAELDIAYRDGWSVDSSTAVKRSNLEGDGELSDFDSAVRLVVPEDYEKHAIAKATIFFGRSGGSGVEVRPRGGTIVRPDGYVAGRGSAEGPSQLLGLLDRTLGAQVLPTAKTTENDGVLREHERSSDTVQGLQVLSGVRNEEDA